MIDGGRSLRKAIVQTSGAAALIQRCQEGKRRNVLDARRPETTDGATLKAA